MTAIETAQSAQPVTQTATSPHRRRAQEWAARMLARDFVVLDTETTGTHVGAEVVQVGVLAPDGSVLLDALVKTMQPIPEVVTRIHGITDERVGRALPFWIVNAAVQHLIAGRIVIAYNSSYDRRILDETIQRTDEPPLQAADWQCAMLAYAEYCGEWNAYRHSYRWQKLPPVPGIEAHGAINDCRATLALLRRMAAGQ